jgi:type VI secretion system secreted protein VgrG
MRIFQDKSAVDIVKIILNEHGISGDQVRFSLTKQYEPREYCVQYRETDFDFISRLLEEEGIFYFFQHDKQKHTMILGDASSVHVPIQGKSSVSFRLPAGLVESEEHIYYYHFSNEVKPGAVKLRDFEFKKPRLNLETSSSLGKMPELEVYDYPGRYYKSDRGNHLNKVRLESITYDAKLGQGRSNCRRLTPGFTYSLSEHIQDDLNKSYLITETTHWGEQTQSLEIDAGAGNDGKIYENSFQCIPADVPYRPPKMTPQPIVHGIQTAIVVGPKGEEIYTDEFGRVKVQFHWDREGKSDEKSSCWIRVSHPWAGGNWGGMFLPRVGQEVIVDFIEGDPDRPIITGRLYNGEKKPPYELPSEKTKSVIISNSSKGGGGSNEIRFEDKKGEEEFYIHAQKDKNIKIENNRGVIIGVNDDLDVKSGDKKTKVLQGLYELTAKDIKITGLNSIKIVCGAGSIEFDATGNITVQGPKLDFIASILNNIQGGLVKINS